MQTATTPKIFSSSFRGFLNGFLPTVLVHFPSPFPPIGHRNAGSLYVCVEMALATREEGERSAYGRVWKSAWNRCQWSAPSTGTWRGKGETEAHLWQPSLLLLLLYFGCGRTGPDESRQRDDTVPARCVWRGRGRISRNRLPSLPSRPLCPAEWTGIFSPGDEMRRKKNVWKDVSPANAKMLPT